MKAHAAMTEQFSWLDKPRRLAAGLATFSTAFLTALMAAFLAAFLTGPSFAAEDEALKKDMASVIALQGMPCGQVQAVKVNAANDYTCQCTDGNRYRVYVNSAGRVVVEKQN